MAHKNDIKPFKSIDELSVAVAELILDTALKSIAERGKFTLVLSGGKTPELLFTVLASPPYSTQMPWKNTFIFWGDERCVPLNDERNNAHRAINLLLKQVNIPLANIHRIPSNLPPKQAAVTYENELKSFFGGDAIQFDCILLGLGEDGHTASLFPDTSVLHDKVAGVREVFVEEQQLFRITLTASLINQAHAILFLVSGKGKAEIVHQVLEGPYEPLKFPSQLITPLNGKLNWFIDIEASIKLK